MDRSIAEGYLRQAEALLHSGDDDNALALLERSLEFYPAFSESLYLQALVLMKRQETLEAARQALEGALDAGGWVSTPPRQAQTELARLYVQSRRYAAARRLLESLAPDRGLGGAGNATLAGLWARALIGEGRLREAESLLERALRRYPGVPELYVLAGELLGGTLPVARTSGAAAADGRSQPREAAEVLDRGLGELPGSLELMYARARVEAERERRIGLLEAYLDGGGQDPGAAALLLIDILRAAGDQGGAGQAEGALERFLDLGGGLEVPLVDGVRGFLLTRRQAAAAADPSDGAPAVEELNERLLVRLEAALKGYTGARVVDADRDGLYEEHYQYENGALQVWTLDVDQNGLAEARAEYRGSEPHRLVFPAPGGSVEYLYSRYPYLSEVAFADGGGRRVYELVPFRYPADVVERATAAGSGALRGLPVGAAAAAGVSTATDHPLGRRLRLPGGVLGEAQARARASRMAEHLSAQPSDRPPDRVHLLLSGETLRIDQDPDASGRYRHQVLYEDGRPASGRRDLDADGRFETREEYRGGELERIMLDQDGDGNPEFTESLAPDSQMRSEKRWDYDSDGRADSRQRLFADGSTVREFSSRLDGSFDLRAVFRSGRLAEFRRGGQALTVRYDSSRGVYRIGQLRGWDRLPDPLTEGIHHRGGRRLFVFAHEGNIYIGELE